MTDEFRGDIADAKRARTPSVVRGRDRFGWLVSSAPAVVDTHSSLRIVVGEKGQSEEPVALGQLIDVDREGTAICGNGDRRKTRSEFERRKQVVGLVQRWCQGKCLAAGTTDGVKIAPAIGGKSGAEQCR